MDPYIQLKEYQLLWHQNAVKNSEAHLQEDWQTADQMFQANKNIFITLISNFSISNPQLAQFALDVGIDPNKDSGFAQSYMISQQLQEYRNIASIKDLANVLKTAETVQEREAIEPMKVVETAEADQGDKAMEQSPLRFLPNDVFHEICTYLNIQNLGQLACVSKKIEGSASADTTWDHIAKQTPLIHQYNKKPSIKETIREAEIDLGLILVKVADKKIIDPNALDIPHLRRCKHLYYQAISNLPGHYVALPRGWGSEHIIYNYQGVIGELDTPDRMSEGFHPAGLETWKRVTKSCTKLEITSLQTYNK